MQSRLPLPDVAGFDAQQRAIHDSILATRGNLEGPFLAWMHSPALASRAEQLGAFCRYGTRLALLESELLILLVAAHFQCVGERQIHEPIAIAAGLAPADAEAIARGEAVAFASPRLALLQSLAHQLLRTNRIDAATYAQAEAALGAPVLVEVVGVLGYYALVAFTLNAFEMRKA